MPAHPVSTYRLQIRAGFDLDAAAAVTGYLADLGVDTAYVSPLLQSTRGSDHGYDVTDVTRVDADRGGPEGLARFSAAARDAGLGVLADIVPNHMGISQPRENPWWWDVLTHGRSSAHADAFDIDWEVGEGRIRVPVLGAPLDEVIGDIRIDPAPAPESPTGLARYFEHILPLAPGSVGEGDDLATADGVRSVLERQHWELRFWQDEATDLNYRRFFAVTTLAAVRVERPEIFDATHAEVLRWVREGLVDGLRVDHPDGLADPGGYLARLAEATGGAYVLVEKILERSAHEPGAEPSEALPAWWATAGTTGYDALAEIDRVLVDPNGEQPLTALDGVLRGTVPVWGDMIHDTKRMIADTIQVSEIRRLVRGLPEPVADAEDALAELLACFPTYRSYLPAGIEDLHHAAREAERRRPDLADAIRTLVPVLSDATLEVTRRFEQTTGPVMAKGVEDTAFYRYTRLGSLTEVGGDPVVHEASKAPARSVGVDDHRPAALGHRGVLGDRQREADVLGAGDLGDAVVIEFDGPTVLDLSVGPSAGLEDRRRECAVDFMEPGVGRVRATAALQTRLRGAGRDRAVAAQGQGPGRAGRLLPGHRAQARHGGGRIVGGEDRCHEHVHRGGLLL